MSHKIRWTTHKIAQRLALIKPLIYRQKQPLPAFRYLRTDSPQTAPPLGADVDDSAWQVIAPYSYWGDWTTNFVLRSHFAIPTDWDTDRPIALYLPLGEAGDFSHPETLTYIDDHAYAAGDRHHQEIRLPDSLRDGQPHRLLLHGWTGLGGFEKHDPYAKLLMRECAVVQLDMPTREFVALATITLEVANQLDENDPIKGALMNALDDAFIALDTRDPLGTAAFYDSVPAALEALQVGIAAAGNPLDVAIVGVGHAHIDVAWLWTLGQTVRKAGRTFSTVMRLMEQYPDYQFSQSQAQLYQYTEQYYPELFEQIKARVQEGRWEVMGGTWVEPDCNVIGAESLARQFLLGRSYFRKHFGDSHTPVLWLPDTFGYSWALPQLIKQAGMKYFVTQKMSWNQYNTMPNQLMWWQGLDGTRVLTHFLTTPANFEFLPFASTYNAVVSANEVFGTWKNFRQKETYDELLMAYGWGDGGGGPTREMIENIQHLENFPGAPRLRFGTVGEYMDRVEDRVSANLPVWNGEFYLEYHRGTYTSQARNKWNNRKSEFLLHDAEFLAALAHSLTAYDYPHADLNQAWELVCLNQFHDILPGSSIHEVYEDSGKDYATIRALGESVRENALTALMTTLPAHSAVLAVNPTSFSGRRIGLLEGQTGHLSSADGTAILTQAVTNGTLIEIPALQPYSIVALAVSDTSAVSDSLVTAQLLESGAVLENDVLRVEFNSNGNITRLYDKQAEREVLAAGEPANLLLAFEDRPLNFDAWDIDIFYEDRSEIVTGVERMAVLESGALRAALHIEWRYRSSTIKQTVYLSRASKRLDFATEVDWHEQHILLKVAFPVHVLSPKATFEVQWGNVERPTHRNTPWDSARFESCAHKWVDLSEGNYGVALLNDCKYGYDVLHHVMRLSLLKSATSPDPQADQGQHQMTYSLLPHVGDWREGVVAAAYDLNDPLILRRVQDAQAAGNLPSSLVAVDTPNVIIETIKWAEDGDGLIVRLFEHQRNRCKTTLSVGFAPKAAYLCNLLEENEQTLAVNGNSITLALTPYQIQTVRLVR